MDTLTNLNTTYNSITSINHFISLNNDCLEIILKQLNVIDIIKLLSSNKQIRNYITNFINNRYDELGVPLSEKYYQINYKYFLNNLVFKITAMEFEFIYDWTNHKRYIDEFFKNKYNNKTNRINIEYAPYSSTFNISIIKDIYDIKLIFGKWFSLYDLIDNNPNLHTLELRGRPKLDFDSLFNLKSLHTLSIYNNDTDDITILYYCKIKKLQLINCCNLYNLDLSINKSITELNLQELNIIDISFFNNLDLVSSITKLCLYRCEKITDFSSLANNKYLIDLNIGNTNISDLSTIFNTLDSLSSLTKLDLHRCEKITDFSPLTKATKLIDLCLSYTNITNLSNIFGTLSLSSLTKLNLCSCTKITDFNPLTKATKLTNLDLSFTEIYNLSIFRSTNLSSSITKLDLGGCSRISYFDSLTEILNLSNLNLSYTKISDISIFKNKVLINKLNLKGCDRVYIN